MDCRYQKNIYQIVHKYQMSETEHIKTKIEPILFSSTSGSGVFFLMPPHPAAARYQREGADVPELEGPAPAVISRDSM